LLLSLKIHVMRYLRQYRSILPVAVIWLITACSSYRVLAFDSKVYLPGKQIENPFTNPGLDKKSGIKKNGPRSLIIPSKKYLAEGTGFKPESKILNMGVEEALKGNYIEAEILFMQVHEIITDGRVENNLAVIFELTKRKKDAMKLYISALAKSPDNPEFRSNLLSFISLNKFETKN